MKLLWTSITFLIGYFWFEFYGITLVIFLTGIYLFLAIIDCLTGYYKNDPKDRHSNIMISWIIKRAVFMIIHFTLLIVCWHLAYLNSEYNIEAVVWLFPLVFITGLNLWEFKSIIENVNGDEEGITKWMYLFIDGLFIICFSWISYILEAIKDVFPFKRKEDE